MLDTKDVFNRKNRNSSIVEISANLYNFLIGITLLWGFAINYYIVKTAPPELALSFGPYPFLIGYFASCFFGIYLFTKSQEPMISFIGYNLVVVPFGFVLNIIIVNYDPDLVLKAIQVTGLVTACMMIAGTLYPAFFNKIQKTLFFSLLAMIIIEFIDIFFFERTNSDWIDWVVVCIFCGYVGYDWGRANQIPKTLDNAIDSAAALYMDIINLFVRILRIMGRKK